MSSLKTQIGGGGGVNDDPLKGKGGLFNCLDDILMANESCIVLPGDLSQMHPIVLVEPKIEIKVELKDNGASPAEKLFIENLLQVPETAGNHKKSKSHSARSANGSVSPAHSNCSNESASSATRRHHHHRHHHSKNSETNKENVPSTGGIVGGLETLDEEDDNSLRHHKHHHHRHHHHHHHHTHSSHNHSTDAVNGSGASTEVSVARPDQVLRKYIIKKITIRKQDGSTKKIVIKKPVDEPNAPVKLTKVVNW